MVIKTTNTFFEYTCCSSQDSLFRPDFDHIPREPFAPPPELLEAAKRKHFAGKNNKLMFILFETLTVNMIFYVKEMRIIFKTLKIY
jgi:hypothetical protein